ncbi:restriction endonuclease [Acetobacter sp. P5B1]|uniref:restriction endonuclease n=1 Tax=Acetobacter sp. P5B1 TaxID=2762620 RepID=UPI001C0409B3|nr:restriction endonuclease [Acetobacter sp. P5B1]
MAYTVAHSLLDDRRYQERYKRDLAAKQAKANVQKYRDAVKRSDGTSFEHSCALTLAQCGWNAKKRGGSGDCGCDVMATYAGYRLVLQCKDTAKPAGSLAVQQALAAKARYNADYAGVVCNAGFTPAAQDLAHYTRVELLSSRDLFSLRKRFRLPERK